MNTITRTQHEHKHTYTTCTQAHVHNGRAVEARASQTSMAAGHKRPISTDISPFNVAEFGTGKPAATGARNPRIQALLYTIMNDKSFTVKQMNNSAKY